MGKKKSKNKKLREKKTKMVYFGQPCYERG